MPSPPTAALRARLSQVLLIAQVALVLLILRNWAYVTTYRLFLDQRTDNSDHSTAVQQFDVEGARVVPRIVTRGPEHITFKTAIGQDSRIHVNVRPLGRARYEISLRDGTTRRVLAQGDVRTATAIVCPFPTGNGDLELASDDAIEWVDPRVVRNLQVGRHGIALAILLLVSIAMKRRERSASALEDGAAGRIAWFRTCTVLLSASLVLVLIEGALRASGDRLPGGIAAQRHDLGEVGRDPRWEESARYGRRLRANVDTVNEWREGDIVRMGFVPAVVSNGALHRFRLRTDQEGFRNLSTRERFDVAALGDSFTDALTMEADASWPVQLEQRLGLAVQNYGTSGFGPQQELLVLKDYVAGHRPRLVVLAFFSGNDIFDAEAFEEFERSGGTVQRAVPGWRIKDVVSRADTWYIVSALHAGTAWLGKHDATNGAAETEGAPEPRAAAATASFDRGMFTVPLGDHVLRWAFMPPYLNTLNLSEEALSARQGWTLTRRAIAAMQQETHAFGAEFVVMFLPFKSQVHLPLLERTFSPEDLRSAFQFYLKDGPPPDIEAMERNRLAQNRLVQQLCAELAIPFLDTTGILQARVEAGQNMFFPDESHLNEAGQAVVAASLAAFLKQTGLDSRR